MYRLTAWFPPVGAGRTLRLLQGLQFLAGLETNCFAGRNRDLRARARIASDAGFARLDGEHAETAKFNAVALFERALHFSEDGLDGHFGLRLGDSRLIDNFVDDIELDQGVPQFGAARRNSDKPMILLALCRCQECISAQTRTPGIWTGGRSWIFQRKQRSAALGSAILAGPCGLPVVETDGKWEVTHRPGLEDNGTVNDHPEEFRAMPAQPSPSDSVLANLGGLLPELETVYKDIHSHPELSMQETRTAGIAAERLRAPAMK